MQALLSHEDVLQAQQSLSGGLTAQPFPGHRPRVLQRQQSIARQAARARMYSLQTQAASWLLMCVVIAAHLDPFDNPQQLRNGWLQERLVCMGGPCSATLVLGGADTTTESFGLQKITCKLPDRQLCWIAAPSDKPLKDWAAEIIDGMQHRKVACGTFTDGLQALRYSPGNTISELCHYPCHVCR